MTIVIIEDETVVAEDLAASLLRLINEPVQITMLHSVQEAIAHFTVHQEADIIFSDIQLGDGLSFEIFVAVNLVSPVVFCTAYNDYALDAFKANGIDYILKPYTAQTLQNALFRYKQLQKAFTKNDQSSYHSILQLLQEKEQQAHSSILVYHNDKIIPVKLDTAAMIYTANDTTHLLTFDNKTYFPNKSLDELEQLCGQSFFRVNRQFLVRRTTIVDVSHFFSRTLSVNLNIPFKDRVTVSKGRVATFLDWLAR